MRPQIVKKITPTVLSFFASAMMLGQARDASSGPPTPSRAPDPPIDLPLPIDSNIVVLVAVGLVFGIYTVLKIRAKHNAA